MLLAASGVLLESRGRWVGEEVAPPHPPGQEPNLPLTTAGNMLGRDKGQPLTFPSASESLELLLLLLESEELPGPCWMGMGWG